MSDRGDVGEAKGKPAVRFEDECFFVAPIGEDATDVRKRSDVVRDFVVKPAVASIGLTVVRADQISQPGEITVQLLQHVMQARAVVADLTGANPNVFYELAVRHAFRLPVTLIAEEGTRIPFDTNQMRTIFFDHRDLESVDRCKQGIADHLLSAFNGAVESPITTAADLLQLRSGGSEEQTLAELVESVARLGVTVSALDQAVRSIPLRGVATFGSNATGDVRRRSDLDEELTLLESELAMHVRGGPLTPERAAFMSDPADSRREIGRKGGPPQEPRRGG